MHRSRPSSSSAAAHYEALFQAASIELHIPEVGQVNDWPEVTENTTARDVQEDVKAWWAETQAARSRDVAFFDERLEYFISMQLPDDHLTAMHATSSTSSGSVPPELQRFLSRLQLTMTASFLRPQSGSSSGPAGFSTALRTSTDGNLAAPAPYPPVTPTMPTSSGANPHDEALATPNPFPGMRQGEEAYMHVEGITVWEGEAVSSQAEGKDGRGSGMPGPGDTAANRSVFRADAGWVVVWRGSLPIAYVRTPISHPLLGLTVSTTLRDSQRQTHKHAGLSLDTSSLRSAESDGEEEERKGTEMAVFEEIDLLGGLGGSQAMPASRLGPSARHDLCVPSPRAGTPLPSTAVTPISAPSFTVPSTADAVIHRERGNLPSTLNPSLNSSMRKSFRRVLSLSSGLRVRMRNLVLPQLLAAGEGEPDTEDDAGERKVVLCVEIENPLEGDSTWSFEIENVQIDIGGKGGKATAALVCAPDDKTNDHGQSPSPGSVFPRRLLPIEQYNLLYSVSIASAPEGPGGIDEVVAKSLGTGETTRPVSITVNGRPVDDTAEARRCPTKTFSSRWNCTLDLTSYFAETAAHSVRTPLSAAQGSASTRGGKPARTTQPNAIAGDKRYSLAALAAGDQSPHALPPNPRDSLPPLPRSGIPPRVVSGSSAKALMPSHLVNGPQRVSSAARIATRSGLHALENDGLLVSVQLLQTPSGEGGGAGSSLPASEVTLRPLEPFSIEIFVHNRTDETRRFRINAPSASSSASAQAAARRLVADLPPGHGVQSDMADQELRARLAEHLASSPALLALENDVRCGPLLPGSSLSARMRFIALREGVHRIEKLRLVGANDDFDHTISPVLDVVIGAAGQQ